MKTYLCIVCGHLTQQYERCPACGADQQTFMSVYEPVKKDKEKFSGKDLNKNLRQMLFTIWINKYLVKKDTIRY
jgi:hypothetical protein